MATLQEIAEYWPNASPQWQADVTSILSSSDEGKQQLRWLQQYLGAEEEDRARRAAEPPSTMDQVATNLGAPLLAGFGSAGGIAAGNALFGAGSGAAGGAAGAGAAGGAAAGGTAAGAGGGAAAAAPTVAGTGAAGGGAATGGTATAAATEAGAGSVLLPAAAVALGAAGTTMGLHDARDSWNQGHGDQQRALTHGVASVASPVMGMLPRIGHGTGRYVNTLEDFGGMMALGGPFSPLALPYTANLAGVNFWSGKSKDQLGRDQVKNRFRDVGLADQDYKLNFNGNSYDLAHPTDPATGKYYQIDWDGNVKDSDVGTLISLANALGITDDKQNTDAVGMLYNAINSGGDPNANMRTVLDQAGGHDLLYGQLHQLSESGTLDKGDADAGKNALDQAYGVGAYAPGGKAYVDPKKKGLLGLGAATIGR